MRLGAGAYGVSAGGPGEYARRRGQRLILTLTLPFAVTNVCLRPTIPAGLAILLTARERSR